MNRNTILGLLCLLFIASCSKCNDEDETATFLLDIKAMHHDQPFVLGQTYVNEQDYQFNVQLLRFYLSHLVLVKDDGTEVEVKDVDYLDFVNNHSTSNPSGEEITGIIPAGNYTAMRFAIGVDSTVNFGDPSVYGSDHPLSVYRGAHWSWNSGYIFMKLEGEIDTLPNGSGTLDGTFLYHTGTTALYRELQFDDDFTVTPDGTFEYQLKLDVDRFFYSDTDTLDAVHDNFSHTMGTFALAEQVTNLFTGAFSKR